MKSIPVSQLTLGMFVADIDRSWVGLPFMLQGFLIDDPAQIEILQAHCSVVQVDPKRSTVNFGASVREPAAIRLKLPPSSRDFVRYASPSGDIEFIDVLKQVSTDTVPPRSAKSPLIGETDRQSALEEEIVYSYSVVRDARVAIKTLIETIEINEKVDLERVTTLVEDIGQGVTRNPDAMIWLARLKQADGYTYDHAIDVSIYLMVFASFIGLDQHKIEQLGLVGLLQDIGKIHLPPDLLSKVEPLSEDDYALVRSHVASSIEILTQKSRFDRNLISVVARHHERHDGSGYPQNLQGERIGLMAEMSGLIDTYCAMTRQRPYGPAVSNQNAIAALVSMRGNRFREALVDEFIQCIGLYPVGSLVELNSGEVAVVVQKNQIRRLKPKLMILLAPDKSPERRPRMLDLIFDPLGPDGAPYMIARSLPLNAYGIDPAEFYLA
jgi:HD-GYP domain-containing protein (c-di-GMP phosphodiesterase class II)